MRTLLIILGGLFGWISMEGQVKISDQKFERKSLEFQILLSNQTADTIFLNAMGVNSSYITLDVCNRAEKIKENKKDFILDFEVDKKETLYGLKEAIVLIPGQKERVNIQVSPLPMAICDYWETEVRLILGFSNMQKWFSDPIMISEDDYYNFKDWLDQKKKQETENINFEASRNSRPYWVDCLKSGDKAKIASALENFKQFYWPKYDIENLLTPLLNSTDDLLSEKAALAKQQQIEKINEAILKLQQAEKHPPSQLKKAIQGLGLAQAKESVPQIIELWKKDTRLEPHLFSRTLLQIGDVNMLPALRVLCEEFEQKSKEKGGFSHDKWKWFSSAALLANFGDPAALEILSNCLDYVFANYEYQELQLLMEALGRSQNEDLKKNLSNYYSKSIQLNYTDDLTLATLPLFLNYSAPTDDQKREILEDYLVSKNQRLVKLAIFLSGKSKIKTLLPILKSKLSEARTWEEQYLLANSIEYILKN